MAFTFIGSIYLHSKRLTGNQIFLKNHTRRSEPIFYANQHYTTHDVDLA